MLGCACLQEKERGCYYSSITYMIIYSVTVSIDQAREVEWVAWMRSTHLPDVMATGCFTNFRFTRVLSDEDPVHGITYNVQYLLPSHAHYDLYQREFAPALQAETRKLFAGSFEAFRTLLELVDHGSYQEQE